MRAASGDLYSVGSGPNGELGHGSSMTSLDYCRRIDALARFFLGLPRIDVAAVAAGPRHCLALSREGRLYSWGAGESGQLGHARCEDEHEPRLISKVADKVFRAVSCQDTVSLALSADGMVYSWGYSTRAQLGLGPSARARRTGGEAPAVAERVLQLTPAFIPYFLTEPLAALAVGADHAVGISVGGHVVCFGDNMTGQLGTGDLVRRATPVRVPFPVAHARQRAARAPGIVVISAASDSGEDEDDATDCMSPGCSVLSSEGSEPLTNVRPLAAAAGTGFSLVLGDDAFVYSAGRNTSGQLGHGDARRSRFFTRVEFFPQNGIAVDTVAACGAMALARAAATGEWYVWGAGNSGELGLGSHLPRWQPTLLAALAGRKVQRLCATCEATFALCVGGEAVEESPLFATPKML